jgi:hypothetical protein
MSWLYRSDSPFAVNSAIFLLAVFLVEPARPSYGQEASLKERFLAEAPRKIDEYEAYCHRIQGSATLTRDIRYADGKRAHTVNRFGFKQNPRCTSFLNEFDSENEKFKKLFAVNANYSFALIWADTASSWVVSSIDAPDSTLQWARPLAEVVLNRLMPQYYLDESPLGAVVRSPGFAVELAEPVGRGSRTLVRVKFRYRDQKRATDRGACPVQGGSMLLDPEHHWCPVERTLDYKWVNGTGTGKEQFEYVEGSQGFFIIKQYHSSDRLSPPAPVGAGSDNVWEYDLSEPRALARDSEFTLSAYGLPEPPGLGKGPTPWYLWAAGLGAACLGLATVLWWRARRAEQVPVKA